MKYKFKSLIMASAIFCLPLAAVASASYTKKTLYVDGVKVHETNAPMGLHYSSGTGGDRITLGGEGHRWYLYNEYVGKMDEFAVYAGVLSDPCIAAHYTAKDSNTAYTAVVQHDNPLLWLRFEDASVANGATALNSGSVTTRNGEYVVTGASAGFTKATGINADSNSIVFPGAQPDANGACVDVYDGGEFDYTTTPPGVLNGDLTVELWVNFSDIDDMPANDYPRFFQHNGNWDFTGGYGVVVDENPVTLNTVVGVIGGGTVDYNELASDFNDNQWHHVVITYDSAYAPIVTGRYPEEVMADNPVLYIRFEEDDPCDYSGNNYWVEANELVRIEQAWGSIGKAAYLNGGWVAAANQQTQPALPTDYSHAYAFAPDDITFEFWLYTSEPNALGNFAELFNQCDTNDPNGPWLYAPGATRSNDAGNQKCRMLLGDADGSDPHAYTWENTWVQDANWHHHVVIWDERPETNEINVKWYRDAENFKNSTYSTDGTGFRQYLGPEMDHILIGGYGSRDNFSPSPDLPYDQYIDEFAIYAGVLSEERVQAHYEAGQPKIQNIDTGITYETIQEAIDDPNTKDGNTIVVQPGTYYTSPPTGIDFLGKAITLRSSDPNDPNVVAATIIDCNSSSRGFYFHSGEEANSVLDGFSIINGQIEGECGAIHCVDSSPTISHCIIRNNNAGPESGGGIYCANSVPVISDSTIRDNSPDGIYLDADSTVLILGTVHVISNDIVGEGAVQMDPNGSLDLDDAEMFCNMSGAGTMKIAVGAKATIKGDINLRDPYDPNVKGTINSRGTLRVKDNGRITNAKVKITQATFEDNAKISNSEIHVDSNAPYGTSLFAEPNTSFVDVNIHADGDRYMDLEPNIFDVNFVNVRIFVTITEGVGQARGGMFECRGEANLADVNLYDPNYDPNNEFFCPAMPGTIPDCNLKTWTLERLELVPGAKLNLTNRFPFQPPYAPGTDYDVVYVKELILGANSVLNTSYNKIYCGNLIKEPNAVITSLPLLGFSMINIAMDDQTEFIVRVKHNNYTDYNNPSYNRVHVERVVEQSPDPNGMMRMSNLLDLDPNSPDYNDTINARAQGLFSKAGEEEVFIRFEYLFCAPNGSGELAIYLTDIPELLDHNDPNRALHYVEVDYLSHPPAGRPGSAGSGRFGVFKTVVPKEYLNFVRGTRMEFEFIGPAGTCILINNWDPGIRCTYVCGDVAGGLHEVNVLDFLGVIGECGNGIDDVECMGGGEAGCLDSGSFCSDGYVTTEDALSVGWVECGHLCPADIEIFGGLGGSFAHASSYGAGVSQRANFNDFKGSLLVAGKRYDPCAADFMSDRLYGFDEQSNLVSGPFTMGNDRLNGKLARDSQGELYQLNLDEGLVRLSDSNSVIPTGSYDVNSEPRYSQPATIYVGLQGQAESYWGRPILDAAFNTDYVYITPVVVAPDVNEPYMASAKLELDSNETPPYHVVKIYDDPNTFNPADSDNPNLTGLREIEVDANGNVYVINVYGDNESDILWAYDANGTPQESINLTSINLPAPVAMHVSNTTGMLYLASLLNEPNANSVSVYGLSLNNLTTVVRTIEISYMGHISDITEDPATSTLYVVGFTMPQLPSEEEINNGSVLGQQPFYEPYLAAVPDGNEAAQAVCLSDYSDPNNDLAMPLSIVWAVTEEKCGGADLDDSNDVSFPDFSKLASYWLETNCGSDDCDGADLEPENVPDGDVDTWDLAVLAEHWLETGCRD